MSVMLCTGATFVKKNSCLVARIVSFDTVKSWNSIFLNLVFFLLTRMFLSRGSELVTREFELVTQGFELITRGLELVTRVLLFHFLLTQFHGFYLKFKIWYKCRETNEVLKTIYINAKCHHKLRILPFFPCKSTNVYLKVVHGFWIIEKMPSLSLQVSPQICGFYHFFSVKTPMYT